ncbi:hypothetical protein [Catellicoccus marimammalium]|uniref:Uncharacterized protein n=1 Tax=Catellicoccus marimammalium M35/04/3 TaxID=1234409 RepID=K8ZNN8_9ENTE|nr:hypothetical protein [Catellicoccus marimammalium]EKU27211.1 hypothetical protein C683_0868 [Catellicoccus marimammalium M35/04/3]
MKHFTYGIRFEKMSKPIKNLKIIKRNKNYSLGRAEYLYQKVIQKLGNSYQPSGNHHDFEIAIYNTDPTNTEELEIEITYDPTQTLAQLISKDIHKTISEEKDVAQQQRWIQQEQEIGEQFMREQNQTVEEEEEEQKTSFRSRLSRKKSTSSAPAIPQHKEEPKEEVEKEEVSSVPAPLPSSKPNIPKRNLNMDFEPASTPVPQHEEEPVEEVKEEVKEEVNEPELPTLMNESEFLNANTPQLQNAIDTVLQPIITAKDGGVEYILSHLNSDLSESDYQNQLKEEYLQSIYSPEKYDYVYQLIKERCAGILGTTKKSLEEAKETQIDTINYSSELEQEKEKVKEEITEKCNQEKEEKKQKIDKEFESTKEELQTRHDQEKKELNERQTSEMKQLEKEHDQRWEQSKSEIEEENKRILDERNKELEFTFEEKTINEKNGKSQEVRESILSNSVKLIEALSGERDAKLKALQSNYQNKLDDKKEEFDKAEQKHIQEEKEEEKKERRAKAEAHRQRLIELKEEENRIARLEAEKMAQKNEELTQEIKGLKEELQDTISKQKEQAELDRMKNLQYQNQVLEQQNDIKYQQMQVSSSDQSKQEISKLKKMIAGISVGAVLGMGAIGFGVYGHFENKQAEAEARMEQQKKEEAQKEEQKKMQDRLDKYDEQLKSILKSNDDLKKENDQKTKEVEKLQKKVKQDHAGK